MDKRYLESSEFYSRRYNNFSIMIILPTVIIFCGLVLFSFFGKCEITIEGQGNLETKQNVPVIQGSTNSILKKNYLKEGRFVKAGQTLLVYKNNRNENQKQLLNSQIDNLNRQISGLEVLKSGLQNNQNNFKGSDQFGYQDLLNEYLDQRQIYLIENKMFTDKSAVNMNKQHQASQLLEETINRTENNLKAYRDIYHAVSSNQDYTKSAKYYYIYQGYQSKMKITSDQNERDSFKSETLATIQQQIDSLQDASDNARSQKVALQEYNDLTDNVNTNNEKLSALQAEQVQSANQQLSKAKQTLIETKITLNQLSSDSSEYTIKAPKAGVLHLNDELKGVKYTGTGSTLAKIYPNLNQQSSIQIKAYIPSQDISSVQKGQQLRLQITRNVPKSIILQGAINNISVSPITLNQGSYYVVTANAPINEINRSLVHYGMEGKVSLITGKTTFFNYYKAKLFNQDLNR